MLAPIRFYALALIILFFMGACERNVDSDSDSGSSSSSSSSSDDDDDDDDSNYSEYYEEESDYQWDDSDVTTITFNDNTAEITGEGAVFEGDVLTISEAGSYIFDGNLTDGEVLVSTDNESVVKIILNGVSISCSDNPGIYIEKSLRTILLLNENTSNTVTDGTSYTDEDANAAIFSKSDLRMSGEGTLTVDANYKDGLTSKDGLVINSGSYNITANDDGIRGKDYLVINNGTFVIDSNGDAIKSDNEISSCGYINIINGAFTIDTSGDGIYAYNNISLTDGDFDITCSGSVSSSKGIKAGTLVYVENGEFSISSVDDAVHSDLDILLSGGTFTIASNDDGFHAENELEIDYADIEITKSYEGLEASTITIEDGIIELTASDDGVNAAGSNSNYLYINGGTLIVYAYGDGLDMNGSGVMTDGTVLVHGPTNNGNGALDYDGSFKVNGGFLIAAGSSGMAEAPSTSSSQKCALINFTSTYTANTLFHLEDSDGNTVATFNPAHSYSSVAISSPDLNSGTTYSIYTGGSSTGTELGGLYSDGEYTPGSLYKSFTVSSTITTVGSQSSGGGGRRSISSEAI